MKFNLPSFLFTSLFSSILIHYLSVQYQEQQSFRNHWSKCLPVLYEKQLVTLGQNHLSRCPPSKYRCTVIPFNKLLVCQADAHWRDNHEKVTYKKQSKPESMIQRVLLSWSNIWSPHFAYANSWEQVQLLVGEARFSTLMKYVSILEHWGLAFPSRRLGQRTETKVLATLTTKVIFSSHVFVHLKLQVPSKHWKSGTRHQIENLLSWFLPRRALLHWLQREPHICQLTKGYQLNPTVLTFPAWLADGNVSPPQNSKGIPSAGLKVPNTNLAAYQCSKIVHGVSLGDHMEVQHLPPDSAVAVCSCGTCLEKQLHLPLLSDCLWLGTSVKMFKCDLRHRSLKKINQSRKQ